MPADVTLHPSLEAKASSEEVRGLLEQLDTWAAGVLGAVEAADAELSVMLCSDAAIQALNGEWRGKEVPTDVLSFPQGDMPPGAPRHLGDVVISLDTAMRQATEQGHSLAQEMAVLLVHGVLHLLGHDHDEAAERARMHAEEQRLLAALGGGGGLIERAGGQVG